MTRNYGDGATDGIAHCTHFAEGGVRLHTGSSARRVEPPLAARKPLRERAYEIVDTIAAVL